MDSQTFTTIISTCAVVFTAWMAYETRKMAKISNEAFKLEKTPILGVKDILVEVPAIEETDQQNKGNNLQILKWIRVGVVLFNAGRVPLQYKVDKCEVSFVQRIADSEKYLSKGSIILPGSSASFWHPGITLSPPIEKFPNNGRIKIALSYSDINGQYTQQLEEIIEYTLSGATPGSKIDWLHVDESQES